ncbi:MAG TPA: hypothetical protein VLO00_03100, partial [Cryobacterium sp.]|nr:hypothetical protein [Cryobacterium sp.]
GRTCLVLEQLTGGALNGLLEGGRPIHPGEAVTILAPVAAALVELQAIGLLHPSVNLSTILFDAAGRPVVTGLGQLRPLPGAGSGRSEALEEVHGRLAQVVRAVLDQVEPGATAPSAQRDLDRWCVEAVARSAARTPSELEHLLFAWAEAVPVRLSRTREAGNNPQPPGAWLRQPIPDEVSRPRATYRRPRADTPAGKLTALLGRRPRVRRGPLLLAALVAVVSTGLALTVLDPGGSAEPAGPTATAGDDAENDTADANGTAGDEAAVNGDDPVVAVPALLRIRARCLGELSIVCLDGVHQARSAALAADGHTLRLMQQGGGAPEQEDLASWAGVLVERTGDVALVSLQAPDAERQPASVLVVKGEAGWRIRDIFDY